MYVVDIQPNVSGKVIVNHLMDALDDAEQLCEDYNASPALSAAITGMYHLLDAMRCHTDCGQEVDDVLTEMVRAGLPLAGIHEDSISRIESRLA